MRLGNNFTEKFLIDHTSRENLEKVECVRVHDKTYEGCLQLIPCTNKLN